MYAGSATASIPPGPGTKTISFQFGYFSACFARNYVNSKIFIYSQNAARIDYGNAEYGILGDGDPPLIKLIYVIGVYCRGRATIGGGGGGRVEREGVRPEKID